MTLKNKETLAAALLRAVIDCGHEIDAKRIVLHFEPKRPGHNALNQLSQRIDAAVQASATPAPAMRWSPINTAPKDGQVILVDDNSEGGAPWAAAKWLASDEWSGWIYDDDVMNDCQPLGPNPTRWLEGLDASVDVAKEQAASTRAHVAESADRLAELKAQLELALQAGADARRAGRAEALAILLGTSAEDFPEIYIGEHTVGEGDSLSFHWREDALRTLFLLNGAEPAAALIERVTDAWWSQEHTIDELRDRLRNGPKKIENLQDFFAEAKLLDLRASDLAPKLAARPEFAAEVAQAAAARGAGATGG